MKKTQEFSHSVVNTLSLNLIAGILLLFLIGGCSSNHSSGEAIASTNTPEKAPSADQASALPVAVSQRRDSLLMMTHQLVSRLDSLHQAGVPGTDSIRMNLEQYENTVKAWYESPLEEGMKMCVDVKRIFRINDDLRSKHLENYLDLLGRIHRKLPASHQAPLRQQYQQQLSRDVLHFLQPFNEKLEKLLPFSIRQTNAFCPDAFSKEKERELKGKTNQEAEMKATLASFQANPIVQTYAFYKGSQLRLLEDLTGLTRRYYLFF